MSASAHLAIQQQLLAALTQSPALASGRVYANPVRELPDGTPTAITLTTERSDATEATLHALDWRTTYRVDCLATAAAGTEPAAAVDDLLQAAWQRLAALPAGANGLMRIAIDPAIVWDFAPGLTPQVAATIRVVADHRTTPTSLSPWP